MKKVYILGFMVGLALFSCKKEEQTKTIAGRWIIDDATVWGLTVPGDGSYLEFNECNGDTCTGVDYDADDKSSGALTYILSNDESTLYIDDLQDNEGGDWDGNWQVNRYTQNELDITLSTILGDVKYRMSRQ